MKVNIPHDMRNFVHWFFLRTVTMKAKEVSGGTDCNISLVPGWEKLSFQEVDIKLTINGVDCDFMQTVMSLDKSLDQFVLEKAQALIKEHVANLQDSINEIQKVALAGVARIASDMGVELRDEDRY